jgi:hypothetical protein
MSKAAHISSQGAWQNPFWKWAVSRFDPCVAFTPEIQPVETDLPQYHNGICAAQGCFFAGSASESWFPDLRN